MRLFPVLTAMFLLAAGAAQASAPTLSAERSAKLTPGDDLVVRVKCVAPNDGRYCVTSLKLNVAGGGGTTTRQLGGIGNVLREAVKIPKGLFESVRFDFGKVGASLMDDIRGSALNRLGNLDGALQTAEGNIRVADPSFASVRPAVHGLTEGLRQMQGQKDASEMWSGLKDTGVTAKELAATVDAAAARLLEGDERRQAEQTAQRLKETVKVATDALVLYLGLGKRVIVNLR